MWTRSGRQVGDEVHELIVELAVAREHVSGSGEHVAAGEVGDPTAGLGDQHRFAVARWGAARQDGAVTGPDRRHLGRVFEEVPALYDRVRPGYPDALFADLVAIAGMDRKSAVLEVGCGTGQATRSLAALGCSVTALEPGAGMAALARRRLAAFSNADVETSAFEHWDDRGRRFDVLVAASSWHWVDPSIGWPRAHELLRPGGWMALLGNVVVRRPGEPEVYAETADLHERFSPGNPGWGHPPLEDDVRRADQGWGLVEDPGDLFGPTIVRWYPTVQWFTGQGFADLLRSTSLYRGLPEGVREPLLESIAERIRVRMDDRASRRYLSVLRVGRRTG
jgi:SAM-dependent methyltransferase